MTEHVTPESDQPEPDQPFVADVEATSLPPQDHTYPDRLVYTEDDMVVISKALVINVFIAAVFFIVGGTLGTFLGPAIFNVGPDPVVIQQAAPEVAQQPAAPPARLDEVSVDDDPFIGSQDAPVTIVEFSDFRCGFCRRFHQETYTQLLNDYGDQIRFVYRDFPVVGGQRAAEAANCAIEQDAFWDFHDTMFVSDIGDTNADFVSLAEAISLDTQEFQSCLEESNYTEEVANDMNDARAYGVTGTPTFFINGVRVVGAQPYPVFQQVIDQELEVAQAGG